MIAYVFVHTLYTSICDIFLCTLFTNWVARSLSLHCQDSLTFVSARFIYRLFLVMTDVTNLMLLNVFVIIREITGGPGRLLSDNLVLFLIRFGS